MKKSFKILIVAVAIACCQMSVKAQSISDLFSSSTVSDIVDDLLGGGTATSSNVVGTWSYTAPAVELTSSSTLAAAAGTAITSKVESTLATYCEKAGITAGKLIVTMGSDASFSFTLSGGKSIGGTYSVTDGVVTFTFAASSISLGSIDSKASVSGDSLSLLFTTDKLLSLVTSLSSSSSSTLSSLGSVISNYDGMLVGLAFSQSSTTTTTSTSTTTSTVSGTISNLLGK